MLDYIFEHRLFFISVLTALFFLWFILHNVKKERIKEAYALVWVLLGVSFLVITLIPQYTIWPFANFIGIYYGPGAIFLVLIILMLIIMIQFSIVISKQSERIKNLAQETALLKNKLEGEREIPNSKFQKTNFK